MVEKLKDAANLFKAKFKKDELQQNLVQATSEQNWQASTTLLHQIANSAYNYEKCQQINQFIWDKLKKKTSWRKILKTLNLVEFLIKNGPPSLISSYKYQLHTFRSFSDYSYYSENIDRGQAIREKSKTLVQLLSNQQILQEQRQKAKNIRDKMSKVTGGSGGYGGYGSSGGGYGGYGGGYGGYDSKPKKQQSYNSSTTNYSNNTNNVYGNGYNQNKSTLDKYKGTQNKTITGTTKTQQKKPNITNVQLEKPDITQTETKKPYEKIAPRLNKPGQKPKAPNIVGDVSSPKNVAQTKQNNFLDDDIFGVSQPVAQTKPQTQAPPPQSFDLYTMPQPQTQTQPLNISPIYPTAPVTQTQQFYQQQAPVQNTPYIQNLYGNTPTIPTQNINLYPNTYQQNQYQQHQQYQQYQQPAQPAFNQQIPQQTNNWAFNPNPNPNPNTQNLYMNTNPIYGQTSPQATQATYSLNQGISLSSKKDDEFGNFVSGSSSNQNVSWLSDKEKGLIDFSDFGTELKKTQTKPTSTNKGASSVGGWQW